MARKRPPEYAHQLEAMIALSIVEFLSLRAKRLKFFYLMANQSF